MSEFCKYFVSESGGPIRPWVPAVDPLDAIHIKAAAEALVRHMAAADVSPVELERRRQILASAVGLGTQNQERD